MSDDTDDFPPLSGYDIDNFESPEPIEIPKPRRRKKKRRSRDDNEGFELIRAALESHLVEYAKKRQDQKRNVEQLSSIIEEYLSSFVLLGYNYDGEPVTLVSASTQQQSDSLSTLIQKFIMSQIPGAGPSVS